MEATFNGSGSTPCALNACFGRFSPFDEDLRVRIYFLIGTRTFQNTFTRKFWSPKCECHTGHPRRTEVFELPLFVT